MKLGKTKKHLQKVVEMVFDHFEASELCNGFVEQARKILANQQGFASLPLGGEEYVLAFWWGTRGPVLCVLGEDERDEEMKKWLRRVNNEFGKYFRFQVRYPKDRQEAIKELAATFGCPGQTS